MTSVETGIDVGAPAGAVWAVLTDLPAYGDWNPLFTRASGRLAEGARVELRLRVPGGGAREFTARVAALDPGRRLELRSRTLLPKVLDRRHRFGIEPGTGGVLFVHTASVGGLLAARRADGDALREGMVAMNEALKDRVEARTGSGEGPDRDGTGGGGR